MLLLLLSKQNSFSSPGVGDKLSISVTNKFGDVFTNLTVVQVLGDGLVLEHSAGQLKIKYEDLPQNIRAEYQSLSTNLVEKQKSKNANVAAFITVEKRLQAEQSQNRAAQEQNEQPETDNQPAQNIEYWIIRIPNQDWKLTVANLGFGPLQKVDDDNYTKYETSPGPDGWRLSISIGQPVNGGTSHDDVMNNYWGSQANNPLINQQSVNIERTDRFDRVFCVAQSVPNVNFYFAHEGSWVNVHIAKWPFVQGDEKKFAEFEQCLSYGE